MSIRNFINPILVFLTLIFATTQNANEILIYADSIEYDDEENIIAKGNAKIISEDQILFSELIILNQFIYWCSPT